MSGSDGRIVYRIDGDNSHYKDSIDEVKKIANIAGKTIDGIFKGTTALVGGVITGTVALIKNVATAYGDYEQMLGGIQSVFGDTEQGIANTNRVMDMASKAWQNLTMSESEYYNQFMSTYPLINASISAGGDAIAETNKLLELSSDLSNTFGYSTETAMTAINWALKGTYSYIDNLNIGIKGTKEGFLEAVNASGLFEHEIKDLSELTSEQIVSVLQYQANIYGVLGKTRDEAETTLQGSFKMLRSSWSNFITALGKDSDEIEKRIEELIYSFDAVLANVIPLTERILAHVPKAVKMIAEKLTELAPELMKTAFEIFSSVVDTIFQQLPTLLKVVTDLLGQVVGLVIDYMPTFLDAVIQTITSIINEISSHANEVADTVTSVILQFVKAINRALPEIITALGTIFVALAEKLPDLIMGLMEVVLENFPIIFDALIRVAEAIVQSLPEIIQRIIEYMPEIISMIVTALIQCAPQFYSATEEIVGSIYMAFINGIGQLVKQIPQIFAEIVRFFVDGWNEVFKVTKERLSQTATSFATEADKIVQKALNITKNIITTFTSIGQKMFSVGKDIVDGIWRGIVAKWDQLVRKVRAKIDSLVASVKSALKISSPSKLFADEIGAMIPAGIAVGVERNEGEAQKAVRGMTESLVGASANVGMAVSPITSSSPDMQNLAQQLSESMGNIKVENEIYLDGMSMARKLYDYQQRVQVERGQNFVPIY